MRNTPNIFFVTIDKISGECLPIARLFQRASRAVEGIGDEGSGLGV